MIDRKIRGELTLIILVKILTSLNPPMLHHLPPCNLMLSHHNHHHTHASGDRVVVILLAVCAANADTIEIKNERGSCE